MKHYREKTTSYGVRQGATALERADGATALERAERAQAEAASNSSVRPRVLLGSTGMLGPIVVVIAAFLR